MIQQVPLLLVEDDLSFGYVLSQYLDLKSYQLDWVKTAEEGLKKCQKTQYGLCILDINLPDMDGFELSQHLRKQHPKMPFIFLTARGLKVDKLKGYKLGCDDYITKPIDEELFLVKIEAILKRTENKASAVESDYALGKYHYEPQTHRLSFGKEKVKLSSKENALLLELVVNQNHLVNRKDVLQKIWGTTDEFSRKSMDVFISKLRKYLAKDKQISIQNVHGKGFILEVNK
ncbi:MAG: response regulator transcription factor [Bacteroidota bacterium]